MTLTSSGFCTAGLVVLISLVVAGILTFGSPDAFFGMIAITMVLMMISIVFLRQRDDERPVRENCRIVAENSGPDLHCGEHGCAGNNAGQSDRYYQPGTVTAEKSVSNGQQETRKDCSRCNGPEVR